MSLSTDIPNIYDLFLFYKRLYRPASIADIDLKIEFQNTFRYPDKGYESYRPGARQVNKNLISSCAYVETYSEEIIVTLRYPRSVCRYMPHRFCPYTDYEATLLLLCHELHHSVLDHIGERMASEKWDSSFMVYLMADILPDCFCKC